MSNQILNISLLFVEDSTDARKTISEMLSRKVAKLYVAKNAEKALKIYKKYLPDVLLSDIKMPGMNGLEMAEKMKRINPQLKIIMMSAYTDADYLLKSISLQVDGYIVKPIRRKKLFFTVKKQANIILLEKKLKKQKKELKKSEQNYKLLTEVMKDVVVRMSPAGKLLYVSPSIKEFAGYTREEVEGSFISDYFAKKSDLFRAKKLIDELVKSPKSGNFEFLFKHKNGSFFPVEHTYFPLISHEKIYAIQLVMRDITEQKNTEVKLKKAKQKAERSDHLKSDFLANMSHEIRTPMNGIIGFAELLKSSNLNEKQTETYVNIINTSGNHLLNLINDIIDISKIDAKRLNVIEKELALNKFLDDIYQFFHFQIVTFSNKIEFLLKKAFADGEDRLFTDEVRLRQILINLLGNAVKFTNSGKIELGYALQNGNILFTVSDTGIGISEKELPLIFERFRQADESSTRKYGGTGLGLAIAKACTELLGGEIWVKSKQGEGTTFSFTIPYKPVVKIEVEQEFQPDSRPEKLLLGKTILIVEDEEISLLILTEMLKDTKATVLHATNGVQAVEMCKNNTDIDMVLMDIQLPQLSGLEATKAIKKIRPDLPIISQTANAMHEDQLKSFEAGCVEHMTKPIDLDLLKVLLFKYL